MQIARHNTASVSYIQQYSNFYHFVHIRVVVYKAKGYFGFMTFHSIQHQSPSNFIPG